MDSAEDLLFSPLKTKIRQYYEKEQTLDSLAELLFKIESRGTTVRTEIYAGLIHFLSTAMILAVNPSQLNNAGYDKEQVASSTALCTGIACLLTGLLANLPFVTTPSLATVIYYSVTMRIQHLSLGEGNLSVFLLGILLMLCSIRVIADFIAWITPYSLKVGICVGFALLVSLQALTHLKLVVSGEFTVLTLGEIWHSEVIIAMTAFFLIGILLHYKVKGAYIAGLSFGSFFFWMVDDSWPSRFYSVNWVSVNVDFSSILKQDIWRCVFDLFVVSSVLLAGLSIGLADLAGISREDGSAPRRRWLYFSCGLGTILSAMFGSGPILLSVESAPGIVAGARTGLSTIVCGCCFLCSFFLYPLFASIPNAGTGPVLLMVGLLLFENTRKVDWRSIKEALPVFITAIFCAFTYSILYGVLYGTAAHIIMTVFSGDAYEFAKNFIHGSGSENDLTRDVDKGNSNCALTRGRSQSFENAKYTPGRERYTPMSSKESSLRRLPLLEDSLLGTEVVGKYETFPRILQSLAVPEAYTDPSGGNKPYTVSSDDSPPWPINLSPKSNNHRKLKLKLRYRRSLSIGESSILSYDEIKNN